MNSDLFPDQAEQADGRTPCAAWDAAWNRHRACRFVWQRKDAILMSKALKMAEGSYEILERRIETLLADEDEWTARNAGPGLLVSHWNQLSYQPKPKAKVGTLLTYVPDRGPRIPPPANLMDLYRQAREAALRATAATPTRRSEVS